ncbi:hypothetical protein HZ326_6531 [Fusarium oxysporum f. sp. albedinis]|nr:hypothetical protein HZ326_6531 [Fusarium oxysporum f. sp. albedinis]
MLSQHHILIQAHTATMAMPTDILCVPRRLMSLANEFVVIRDRDTGRKQPTLALTTSRAEERLMKRPNT